MNKGLPESIVRLVGELRKLPGVGEKTALRYVLHMLSGGMNRASDLSAALVEVIDRVRPCSRCGFPAEGDLCGFCSDQTRDMRSVCVVESVGDLLAVERMGEFTAYITYLAARLPSGSPGLRIPSSRAG